MTKILSAVIVVMSTILGISTDTFPGQNEPAARCKIVFICKDRDCDNLYVVDADGANQKKLVDNKNWCRLKVPECSVDGKQIAFESAETINSKICVMAADGADLKKITKSDKALDRQPAWSPDGKKIAFVSGALSKGDIYVMGADGSNPQNLTKNKSDDYGPVWSPDGKKIAFVSQSPVALEDGSIDYYDPAEIYVMNADGSGLKRLTERDAQDYDPVWSPDSTKLLFTSKPLESKDRETNTSIKGNILGGVRVEEKKGKPIFKFGKPDIFIINIDGSNLQNLTNNPDKDEYPDWSADGSSIVFISCREGDPDAVYIMAANGSNPKSLAVSEDGREFSCARWSPDNKKIAYIQDKEQICVIDANGSNRVEAAKGREYAWLLAK
ncbi:MAG: hypothetical protein V1701_10405 [Planctomycetota bacterium]